MKKLVKKLAGKALKLGRDAANWTKKQVQKASKWVKDQAQKLWKKLMSLFAWAKGFLDVLLNKQTACLVQKVKQKSSMVAGHLNLLISKPAEALKKVIPHLEKEMTKFIKLTEATFKKGGMLDSLADCLMPDGAPNVAKLDKKFYNAFADFAKIEPSFECLLPTIKYATSNAEFNKKRQQLANHLHKLYTRIVEPLQTKMINAAITHTMVLFEKHVMKNKIIKQIGAGVRGLMRDVQQQYMKILAPVMKKMGEATSFKDQLGEKNNLIRELTQVVTSMRNGWKLASLMPMILEPLKTFAFKKIISDLTKQFYIMWDAILDWGGPLVLRAATVALDTVCATANVALEWLCSGGLELGMDVYYWSMQQLREVGRSIITGAVSWVIYAADMYILKPLQTMVTEKVLKPIDNEVAKAKKAVANEAKKWGDLSKWIPKPLKNFAVGVFRRVALRIQKELAGDAGQGFEALINQLRAFLNFNSHDDVKLRSCEY